MLKKTRILNKKKQTWVISSNNVKIGPYLDISESLEITEEGTFALRHGSSNFEVIRYDLRCKGGFHNGHDANSGSNCQKVRFKAGWCSNQGNEPCPQTCKLSISSISHSPSCPRFDPRNMGSCVKGCIAKKGMSTRKQNLLFHGCSFGVIISATLEQVARGVRRIQVGSLVLSNSYFLLLTTTTITCLFSSMGHTLQKEVLGSLRLLFVFAYTQEEQR